jgi:DNA-binding NarL/FixJ family response regulator
MRILLVDDHSLFLESLETLLTASGVLVVGTAADGLAALAQARALHPDLILMDIAMPRCDGLAATRLIKAELPEIRIVMLTASEEDAHLFEAIKSGASGYLLKSLRAPEFLQRLREIENGEPPLSPGLAEKIMRELARQSEVSDVHSGQASPQHAEQGGQDGSHESDALSPRQVQVATLVAQGLTYAQVAETLHLSEATVRYHMTQILARLHLDNRAQVIAYAARMNLPPHS